MLTYPLSYYATLNEIIYFLSLCRFPDKRTITGADLVKLRDDAELVHAWILPALVNGIELSDLLELIAARADENLFADFHGLQHEEWMDMCVAAFDILLFADFCDAKEESSVAVTSSVSET
jgi:hypothetical protein